MATPKGGFDCDFINDPPKNLECTICLLTLREPHVITCCGNQFCRPCIERVQKDKKPCPLCNDPNFNVFLHKGVMREVNALLVRCPQKELECKWEGELGQLQQHLNPGAGLSKNGCGFVEVVCVYKCGGRFLRREVREHESEKCPCRPLEVVMASILKRLDALTAENQAIKAENQQLKVELAANKQEVVQLREGLATKAEVVQIDNLATKAQLGGLATKAEMTQLKEATKAEVAQIKGGLATKAEVTQLKSSLATKAEMTQLKEATKTEVAQLKGGLATKAEVTRLNVTTKELKLCAKKQDVDDVDAKCSYLENRLTPIPPFNFTMNNYEHYKKVDYTWLSDPFYTHHGGYKMIVQVYPNGWDSAKGTHLSLVVGIMRGENDDKLQWPFRGNVTIQTYNRDTEKWDNEYIVDFANAPVSNCKKPPRDSICNAGRGNLQYISHSNIKFYNVYNIRFRIYKVDNVM